MISLNLVTLLLPGRLGLLHPGAQGLVPPTTSRLGNAFGMAAASPC